MADQGLIGNATNVAATTELMKSSNLYTNNNAVSGEGNATKVASQANELMKSANLYTNNNAVSGSGRKSGYDYAAGYAKNDNKTPYRGAGKFDAVAFAVQDKTISGVVTENGVPLANCLIHLHYRPDGACIGRTTSAADGTYSFTGLYADSNYFIVFQDKAGGTVYNDIIQSQFTPG